MYKKENVKKIKKVVDISVVALYNRFCAMEMATNFDDYGVWLSLARAPGLGPGGRRFESCHPDYAGVVQW